jgi:DNA-binding beta-propeller fold protein YncE
MPHSAEVWVVNHLSDSISIIAVGDTEATSRVVRTLLVGDEPRDIVFAGNQKQRAFATCAHRGQNSPSDPQLTQQGVGRADVWVFDRNNMGPERGGTPETIITLFGDTPRALTVSPRGDKVYAAIFHSGNQTTAVGSFSVLPLPKPEPTRTPAGIKQPDTSLIVKYDGTRWVDETGKNYSAQVPFSLPDYDVFTIDATSFPPQEIEAMRYSGVGTTLFNMAVNPVSGTLYISNTESLNQVRFEGSGERGSTIRGHFVENRITLIRDDTVEPRHLNKHLDYTKWLGDHYDRQLSIADPQEMVVTSDGETLYAVAFGSQKIVRFDTEELEEDSFAVNPADQLLLSAGGPNGIVFDEDRNQLYVFTRFNNGISVIDVKHFIEKDTVTLYNPEPASIVTGRPFLYDATLTSGFGDASCSSCHVFGDMDSLAWDLGNPDSEAVINPNDYAAPTYQRPEQRQLHPLKGPMVTQSMRGIADNGPLHWRGDRTGKDREAGESVASGAFKEFNGTFESLLAREKGLSEEEMQQFTDFALTITYPPNPIRALDNSLTLLQAEGKGIFHEDLTTTPVLPLIGPTMNRCVQCHELNPEADKYGTGGTMANIKSSQDFKIPHLRNLYQKVGMFGIDSVLRGLPWKLPQVRGFGFDHDGTKDTLFTHFLFGFDLRGGKKFAREAGMNAKDIKATALISFLMAFDSNLAPIVGQQMTLTGESTLQVLERIYLFIQRAQITDSRPECDLFVKGILNGNPRGWVMTRPAENTGETIFQSDRLEERHTFEALQQFAEEPTQELTFTCVPPGSGMRIGIDRDEDGTYDADERAQVGRNKIF